MDSSRIRVAVRGIVGRGRFQMVDDTGPAQLAQVDVGPTGYGVRDNTPSLGVYGVSSRPPAGSDCIVLFMGGERTDAVIIASGSQVYRLKNLGDGEVALYDSRGQYVWLKSTGIEVSSPTKVTVLAPAIDLGAGADKAVALDGDPVVGGVVKASSTVVKAI